VPDKGLGYGVLKYINKEAGLSGSEPWDIVFNYLGQVDNVVSNSRHFSGAPEGAGSNIGEANIIREKLSVNGLITGGSLQLVWEYSSLHYEEETIAGLSSSYVRSLEELIDHCVREQEQGRQHRTPSDFGLAGEVTYQELDKFIGQKNTKKLTRIIGF